MKICVSMKFEMHISIKISRNLGGGEGLNSDKPRNNCWHLNVDEQEKFHAQ